MARNTQTETVSGPVDRLKSEVRDLVGALGDRAVASVQDKVEGATSRLTDYVEGGAGPGFMAAVTGAKNLAEGKGPVRSALGAGMKGLTEKVRGLFGKGGGGKGKKLKLTSIVESIDVGVPITLAYNQWTQFSDFPSFMKKVENVEQNQDEPQKLNWKAQVFWSHRTWEANIIEQVPDERIVWRSKGEKGHVDGAVTFHELGPNLTRILLVMDYHPQGFFERTGNLWRAQGRRARLELKFFRRQVMTEAILHPDEIEGWRGVIEDGEVVQDHEPASEEEGGSEETEGREPEDELTDEETDQEDADGQDEDAEDEYQEGDEEADEDLDEEGEETSARDGSAGRSADGGRGSGRGRRSAAGRPQRSDRPARRDEPRQRPARRPVATRRGDTQ